MIELGEGEAILRTGDERNPETQVTGSQPPLKPYWLLLLWEGGSPSYWMTCLEAIIHHPTEPEERGGGNVPKPRKTLRGVQVVEFAPAAGDGKGTPTRSPRAENQRPTIE